MNFPKGISIQSHTISIVPRYSETDQRGVVHQSVYPICGLRWAGPSFYGQTAWRTRTSSRRVSCRDYSGAIEDMCDGYGIDKSSVSRKWQAASARQLSQILQRHLDDLDICVILLDGKEFGDTTIITALGVDMAGTKHILGLWPGATENSVVCGSLLDDMIERGLSIAKLYLFIIDGSKALKKAVTDFLRHIGVDTEMLNT